MSGSVSLLEVKVTDWVPRSRTPWLAGGLVAIFVALPTAAAVLAGVGAAAGTQGEMGFLFIFVFSIVDGFIWGAPAAGLVGCLLGSWCFRSYQRGQAAARIRVTAVLVGAAAGAAHGTLLAMLNVARGVDLRWSLVPAATISGAVVGYVVTAAVLADARFDQERQRAS